MFKFVLRGNGRLSKAHITKYSSPTPLQLDWTSCADTHKNNLPQDQEDYDGYEYTDEKLSTRRIQWCGVQFYISTFSRVILKK